MLRRGALVHAPCKNQGVFCLRHIFRGFFINKSRFRLERALRLRYRALFLVNFNGDGLLDRDGLGEIARFVYVATLGERDIIGENLKLGDTEQ